MNKYIYLRVFLSVWAIDQAIKISLMLNTSTQSTIQSIHYMQEQDSVIRDLLSDQKKSLGELNKVIKSMALLIVEMGKISSSMTDKVTSAQIHMSNQAHRPPSSHHQEHSLESIVNAIDQAQPANSLSRPLNEIIAFDSYPGKSVHILQSSSKFEQEKISQKSVYRISVSDFLEDANQVIKKMENPTDKELRELVEKLSADADELMKAGYEYFTFDDVHKLICWKFDLQYGILQPNFEKLAQDKK